MEQKVSLFCNIVIFPGLLLPVKCFFYATPVKKKNVFFSLATTWPTTLKGLNHKSNKIAQEAFYFHLVSGWSRRARNSRKAFRSLHNQSPLNVKLRIQTFYYSFSRCSHLSLWSLQPSKSVRSNISFFSWGALRSLHPPRSRYTGKAGVSLGTLR